jgi:hypothetical protein
VGDALLGVFVCWVIACYAAIYWLCVERPRAGARRCDQPAAREERDEPTEMDEHGVFSDVASDQVASMLGGAAYTSQAVYRRVHESSSGARVED